MVHGDEPASPIRRAEPGDVEELLRICRDSFSESPRWSTSGSRARSWWKTVLSSSSAETWVREISGVVVGFIVLVHDELAWEGERRARDGGTIATVATILQAPKKCLAELRRRRALRLVARRSPLPRRGTTEARTWVELIAASSRARGQGVARTLTEHCEARTRELGRRVIELMVDVDNLPMRRAIARLGYRHAAQTDFGCVYSKVVG
jgi:RimJ/RimL family protein N-acetyltransferase